MSRARGLRLFVALEVPAEVRSRLVAWAREALGATRATAFGGGEFASDARPRGVPRVLPADSLHLTLCFLGSRPAEELPGLSAAVAVASAAGVGELSLGAPVWLPPRRPHALAVEVHDEDGRLGTLQRTVSDELAQAGGWEPERRRHRAQITLARLRGGERVQALPATPPLSFTPQALVLYRSQLHPDGARYEALAQHELAAL
jgi:2'-5' RNA ligase